MEQHSNKNSDISRQIITRYGSIRKANNSNLEVNIISWNNGKKKLDIRPWTADGVIAMKGITLSREGFVSLMKILNNVDISLIDSELKTSSKKQEPPLPPPPDMPVKPDQNEMQEDFDNLEEEPENDVPIITEEQFEANVGEAHSDSDEVAAS